jgi:hypothetical protein
VQHITKDLRIFPACQGWHMKGMIGIGKQLQRCTPAEFFAKRLKLVDSSTLTAFTRHAPN